MIQFKNIRQNDILYIFDRQDVKLISGKVTSVSNPRTQISKRNGNPEIVVDIAVEAEGKTGTYAIPEDLTITYAGDTVIATEPGNLVNEVNNQVSVAKNALAKREYYESIIKRAPDILAELNPMYKEKQETEKRFSKLEGSMSEMGNSMARMEKLVTSLVEKLS